MLRDKLGTIKGTGQGSIFHIIGETPQMLIGVRVFNDTGIALSQKNNTVVVLRVRIIPQEGVKYADLKGVCDTLFPSAKGKWTGGSSSHVSLAGAVVVPRHQYDATEVVGMLVKDKAGEKWYELLKDTFSLESLFLTKEEFVAFYIEEVSTALGLDKDTSTLETLPCIVFDFAKYKAKTQGVDAFSESEVHKSGSEELDGLVGPVE